jgi:hypothetical protein
MPPANRTKHGRLIERDARWLDALLLAERFDFCFGELLHVHRDLGTVEHDGTTFTTRSAAHDGHQALFAGKDGVMRQREP